MQLNHIATEASQGPDDPPKSVVRWGVRCSNSLSSSMVNATSVCERRAERLPSRFRVMPDIDTFYQKQYVFGDVGGMISDALQVARHSQQIHRWTNVLRIFFHEADQLVI